MLLLDITSFKATSLKVPRNKI